jgi:YegS/Rv2252/BmrU family lipid kinase
MKNPFFIVNPTAGGGSCLRKFQIVETRLERMGLPYTVALTERPGHGTELARQGLAADSDCGVAVGGDGTVRDVAQQLYHSDKPLGLLPFGTGNDLIKTLRIPVEPEAALDLLLQGKPQPIDAMMVNQKLCLNVAGFGFDVSVLQRTEQYKRTFRGGFAYILGVLHALRDLRSFSVKIETPEICLDQQVLLVSVGNGRYIGGGMMATPLADPTDGLLDVCVVDAVSRRRVITCLARFMKGSHIHMDVCRYFQTPSLTIACTPQAAVQLDGEIIEETPVRIQVLPGSLSVLCGFERKEAYSSSSAARAAQTSKQAGMPDM